MTMTLTLGLAITSSCGARLKTASEVSGMFQNQDAHSIGALLTDLCKTMRARKDLPNMTRASLTDNECGQAGRNADNYRSVKKAFTFEGLTNEVIKADGKDVMFIRTRAKVWLNHSILDLALKLTKALKNRENGGEDIFSKPADPANSDGLEKLMKVTTKELKKTEFNQTTRTFSGSLNISGSGLANLNNDIEINGQIFADSIGININSTRPAKFEDSLIKDVSAIGIVTPYASDVYVDIVFEVNIHSIGLNNVLFEKINSALGSSLKTVLDTLLKLK